MDKYENFLFKENSVVFLGEPPYSINEFSKNDIDKYIKHNMCLSEVMSLNVKIRQCYAFKDYQMFVEIRSFLKDKGFNPDDFITDDIFIESKNNLNHIKQKTGYIYILESQGYYKIGKTINIKSRISKYTTENPNEINIIHTFKADNYTKEEERLHKKFKKKNHRGEWFDLDEKDINYILTL